MFARIFIFKNTGENNKRSIADLILEKRRAKLSSGRSMNWNKKFFQSTSRTERKFRSPHFIERRKPRHTRHIIFPPLGRHLKSPGISRARRYSAPRGRNNDR
jgi:hypothetical protein